MFLSMMRAYFQGRRELFKGLALDSYPHWDVYPVWHFSMGQYEDLKTPEAFDPAFAKDLEAQMIMCGLDVKSGSTANQLLRDGFRQLFLKKQKVVILIDEYDKPLIDSLDQPERAMAFHDYLASFYSIMKHQADQIEFLFITGITRFEKLNIFSGLNQLQDITLDRYFHGIAGFTEAEIREYYGEYIQLRSKKKRCSQEAILQELAIWYNGYQWVIDEEEPEEDPDRVKIEKIYNPISVMKALDSGYFQDYWIETGQQSRFLINYIRQHGLDPRILTGPIEREKSMLAAMSYQNPDAITLLWQAGYLTIKDIRYEGRTCWYTLTIPNVEIEETIRVNLIIDLFLLAGRESGAGYSWQRSFKEGIEQGQVSKVVGCWQQLLQLLPHYAYDHVDQKAEFEQAPALIEAFYHMSFEVCCRSIDYQPISERVISAGRIDLVLELATLTWIFEFKHSKDGDGEKLAAVALAQIHDRGYHLPYLQQGKKVILVGIGMIDRQAYQVSEIME